MIEGIVRRLSSISRSVQHKINVLRHDSELKDSIAILLTSPRSGSTWLFDVLRCHPAVSMHPRFLIHRRLQLQGRRYPRDLSNKFDNGKLVETIPTKWDLIPNPKRNINIRIDTQKKYNIEKIHPHFFDHDVEKFVRKVEKMRQRKNVNMIYQVRDPKETITSFMEYKKRKPSWDSRDKNHIPTHIRRIFGSISKVSNYIQGHVVEYESLKGNFYKTIKSVFGYMFSVSRLNFSEVDQMYEATSRDKSEKTDDVFLSPQGSSNYVSDYESYFMKHKQEVDRCYDSYESIID